MHGLAGIPLESPHGINNLLKREAQINYFLTRKATVWFRSSKFCAGLWRAALKTKALCLNKEECVPVCWKIIIRSSGRNQPGRGMWPESLFYSIPSWFRNLRYQGCGGGWSAVVWWDKKWILASADGLSLGQQQLVPRGKNESPGRGTFCLSEFPALRGKCNSMCRNRNKEIEDWRRKFHGFWLYFCTVSRRQGVKSSWEKGKAFGAQAMGIWC